MMKQLLLTWPLWLAAGLAMGQEGGWNSNTNTDNNANAASENNAVTSAPCLEEHVHFNPFQHKKVYTVGVHAIDGLDAAKQDTNATFGEYLSETVGKRFDPPIQFRVVPLYFDGIFKAIDNEELDFLYR